MIQAIFIALYLTMFHC